ncbi:acyl-CoA carboxylase epsilon subunit [Zhihengliuella flava]|uniref:Acyl-CoA carboxylase subunit epsilon n=1 Tax=Zhihengliuella flava TaxID=1285193 RepID=A0A931D566_9MICC|nr:acyl-CoA carboxylase epsilon subunit [Zhihengliuella flava]MBG6083920.1 hypothetical protein [Zhihengliuella flava]
MSESSGENPTTTTAEAAPHAFEVTRGQPTAEELAALAAVVLSAAASGEETSRTGRTRKDTIRTRVRDSRRMVSMPGAWRSGRF